jgi:uncharacterized protein YqjF (DUF2071 family)
MVNYAIEPELLRPLVPLGTELDVWQGTTYLSLVAFSFLRTRVRGVAIPCHRDFEEVNLRFYVRRDLAGQWRRGVVFIKEIVPKWAIAAVARRVYNENYVAWPMDSRIQIPDPARGQGGVAEYGWGRSVNRCFVRAEFVGEPSLPAPGSQEEFIAEHYWGYVTQRSGQVLEYEVAHPPWRVWQAKSVQVGGDLEYPYGPTFAAILARPPQSAFVAEGSAVTVYPGRPLDLPLEPRH